MKRFAIILAFATVTVFAGDIQHINRLLKCGVNDSLSLDPCYWLIRYSPGMPDQPSNIKGEGWSITFPRSPLDCYLDSSCEAVHYITTPYTNSMSFALASSITMTFSVISVSGNPLFGYRTETVNTGSTPLHVRFLLERSHDDMCAAASDPSTDPCRFWRWWSNPVACEISSATGVVTLTAPLAPGYWTSVFGESNATPDGFAGWQDVLANIGYLGMTFGGGSFFGHGGFVIEGTGSAKFVLLDFRLD